MDNDGDAVNDLAFRVRFSPVEGATQSASVQQATGRDAAADVEAGETIVSDAPVTFGAEPQVGVWARGRPTD
ncbi:hypothetical protein [Streptomyces sp. NPDC088794]|uniref:hypothetical protein n=1 Tax=Streptomyces sp. NPDC088794 TaxID=3365902 RepID=UPI00380D8CC2